MASKKRKRKPLKSHGIFSVSVLLCRVGVGFYIDMIQQGLERKQAL